MCTFHIPKDTVENLLAVMESALAAVDAWMRKLAKITGKLLSMSLAIPMTRLVSRSLCVCMHSLDWDGLITSSVEAVQVLGWMVSAISPFNAIGFVIWIQDGVADFDITADASPAAAAAAAVGAHSNRCR